VFPGEADPLERARDVAIDLLANEEDRRAFVSGWPGWGPEKVAALGAWAGAGVPNDVHVARWDADEARRLDGAVRHTLGLLMKLDLEVGLETAWAWEGLGLYLGRELVGTRLTWYGSGQATSTPESKELLGRLLMADVNWMNEAYQMLQGGTAPKLETVLARDIDSIGVRDVLVAYAFAAYLLEAEAERLPGILRRVGAREASSAEAVSAALGRGIPEVEDRLVRWLGERR
jgi:hypothetical protein